MKISKKFDFLEEKTYTKQDEKKLFSDENENISDKIKTNTADGFEPKTTEEIEFEAKIKKENFLDKALQFKEAEITFSNQ